MPLTIQGEEYLTIKEVAGRLGVSSRRTRNLVKSGRFPGAAPATRRLWLVPAKAVDAFLADRQRTSQSHAQRRSQALRMREDGHTWADIASATGYANKSCAYHGAHAERQAREAAPPEPEAVPA